MNTYEWRSWGGSARSVEAERLTFEPGYVAFWNGSALVLAVQQSDCNNLRQQDTP